jgi:hypothetical protein
MSVQALGPTPPPANDPSGLLAQEFHASLQHFIKLLSATSPDCEAIAAATLKLDTLSQRALQC